MVERLIILTLGFLTACVPATLVPSPTSKPPTPTAQPRDFVTELTVELPSETPAIEPTATRTPAPTKTEWELAQEQVSRLRNLLDSNSDGYNGLTIALEQAEPNKDWCNGLTAGINDFDYIKDTESSETLQSLKEMNGCP
jgi:hypothetical protein